MCREGSVDFEEHRRVMLAHCVRLAETDKAYAWWAAKRYARESEGVLADLPQQLADEVKRKQAQDAEGVKDARDHDNQPEPDRAPGGHP